jgi:uncharacterized protein (DUF1697 family)
MMIYIALLRGINVGGKNIIKMADLKSLFEQLGLNRVQTYIQSGNVLFESDSDELSLRKRLEQEIEAAYGFSVTVVIRTAEELKKVIANCPFSEEEVQEAVASSDAESLYVALLLDEPSEERIKRIQPFENDNEKYRIAGREVYLLFHQSIRNSKLASNLHLLDVPATTRNWKTINKLVGLAGAMDGAE